MDVWKSYWLRRTCGMLTVCLFDETNLCPPVQKQPGFFARPLIGSQIALHIYKQV